MMMNVIRSVIFVPHFVKLLITLPTVAMQIVITVVRHAHRENINIQTARIQDAISVVQAEKPFIAYGITALTLYAMFANMNA
jgi:hypothetical protein